MESYKRKEKKKLENKLWHVFIVDEKCQLQSNEVNYNNVHAGIDSNQLALNQTTQYHLAAKSKACETVTIGGGAQSSARNSV